MKKIAVHQCIPLLVVFFMVQGCEQPILVDKHDAEESGYLVHFKAALTATCKVGTTEQVQTGAAPIQTQCGMTPMGTPMMCTSYVPIFGTVEISSLAAAGINAVDVLNSLEKTLPPTELEATHALLRLALNSEIKGDTSLLENTSNTCISFTAFEQSVSARENAFKTTDSLFITYKPPSPPGIPGIPSVKYDTKDGFGFGLDQSYTLPTAYGNITMGYKSAPGIHMLRIVSEDKQRFMTLDRPFEFLVPKGYSTRVAFEGKDELILYVNKD